MVVLGPAVDFAVELYLNSRIVLDNWKQHVAFRKRASELSEGLRDEGIPYVSLHRLIEGKRLASSDIEDLAQIVVGAIPGRKNCEERVMLLTAGLPTEDIGWAYTLYKTAIQKQIGSELVLWEEPFWK
jgi:ornithine cyclodeaminase